MIFNPNTDGGSSQDNPIERVKNNGNTIQGNSSFSRKDAPNGVEIVVSLDGRDVYLRYDPTISLQDVYIINGSYEGIQVVWGGSYFQMYSYEDVRDLTRTTLSTINAEFFYLFL